MALRSGCDSGLGSVPLVGGEGSHLEGVDVARHELAESLIDETLGGDPGDSLEARWNHQDPEVTAPALGAEMARVEGAVILDFDVDRIEIPLDAGADDVGAAEAQQAAIAAKAQANQQQLQMETQAKLQYRQGDISFEIEKLKQEAMLKSQLMQEEFNLNMQLRQMDAAQLQSRESAREKSKSERISQQSTDQSQLINQRKNNLPPKNFESNEDSLDGFDMAEFNPR